MIKLYCENKKFGEHMLFNTQTGDMTQISECEFDKLRISDNKIKVYSNNTETHTIFPRIIYFQITRKCNLSCPYCFISAGQAGKEVPWDDVIKISDFIEEQGGMEVRLTGGEPTLHSRFQDIVSRLIEKNIFVSVATNGCWNDVTMEFFKRTQNIFLIISIDGDESIQDTYRSNSFEMVKKNIEELRKFNKKIRIRFNTVLTKENYLNIKYLFKIAKKYNVEYINFIPLKPQLRYKEIKNIMLSSEEYEEAVKLMVYLRSKYDVKFNTSIISKDVEEILKDNLYRKRKHCSAGTEGVNLDYDFEKRLYRIYGCAYSPAVDLKWNSLIKDYLVAGEFPIEQIENFGKIWNNDDCWKLFRSMQTPLLCMECKRYGNGCVGVCVVQNLNYERLEEAKDIDAELMYQLLNMQEHYCI